MTDLATALAPFRESVLTQLSDEDLASVLLTYPACCVAVADGTFDDDERLFILEVCENLGDSDDPSSPQARLAAADRYACLMQLMEHRKTVDAQVLAALKAEVAQDSATGDLIRDMLEGAALASGDATAVERKEISRIHAAIGL